MNRLFTLLLFAVLFSFNSNAQDGHQADLLAERIISSMKKFDTTNEQTLRRILISEKEIPEFIAALDMPEEEKVEMENRLKDGFLDRQYQRNFERIVVESRETGINWKNIEYEDFLYKLRLRDGVKELKGDIYFKDGEEHYEMRVHAGLLNGRYIILELEDLDVSYELHGYPEGYDPYEDLMVEEYVEEEYAEEAEELTPEQEQLRIELEKAIEEMMVAMEDEMDSTEVIEEESDEYYEEEVSVPPVDNMKPMVQADEIYGNAEKEASFPGGARALQEFINSTVQYPQDALEKGISGKVYLSFVVEKDGSLTNIEVARSAHELLDREALRVVRAMPNWIPGESEGRPVRTRTYFPIVFALD